LQTAEDSEDSDVVKFVALRPISAGEELFIDYGQSYDRSSYCQ
jgi:SET domain-containing protein